jgi:hypothetical protein
VDIFASQGVNNTVGKFATGINETTVNLPPVSMVLLIPVANLQPVTTSLAVNCVVDTGGKYRVQQ